MLKKTFAAVAAIGVVALAAPAHAQSNFPSKPISIVVPFAAGGPTDTVARNVAEAMQRALGGSANVLVENKPGAGGTIGAADVARAPADGHRLLIYHIGMSTAPALYRKLPFDPLKDYEYVGLINEVPMTLLSKPQLPANNAKELVAYIKANKDKVTLANAGLGAASHLCGLLFQSAIETELTTVPYKGTAPALTDLMGGQVDLLCDQTTNTTPHIKSGKVKAFAVTADKRLESLPDVPTASEAGLKGFDLGIWHGMYAPKGTPKPVIDKLTQALQTALKDPELQKRFADLGAISFPVDKQTPQGLQNHLKSEIDKWSPIIKKAGVYAD